MKNKRPDSGGFTLLEVMVATAVVGGLLVTLIYTLNHHLAIASRHEFEVTATLLAKNKLEELQKSPASSKGNFEKPYDSYGFSSEVKTTQYPGISEITVSVEKGGEKFRMSRLVEKSK